MGVLYHRRSPLEHLWQLERSTGQMKELRWKRWLLMLGDENTKKLVLSRSLARNA